MPVAIDDVAGPASLRGRRPTGALARQAMAPSAPRRPRLVTMRLVREGTFVAPCGYPDAGVPISGPHDVYERMRPYVEREISESFWILPLDSQNHLVGAGPVVITRGILNASLVHPREVFLAAIATRAAAVILCHNHPSGDPTPSEDDRAVTTQLVAAGQLLDIPVHDHVISGRGCYVSFAESDPPESPPERAQAI